MKVKNIQTQENIGHVTGFVAIQHEVLAIVIRDDGSFEALPINRLIKVELQEGVKHGIEQRPVGMAGPNSGNQPGADGQPSPISKSKKGKA